MYMMPTKNERSDYPSISNANELKKSSSKCTDLSIALFEETKVGPYEKILIPILVGQMLKINQTTVSAI